MMSGKDPEFAVALCSFFNTLKMVMQVSEKK